MDSALGRRGRVPSFPRCIAISWVLLTHQWRQKSCCSTTKQMNSGSDTPKVYFSFSSCYEERTGRDAGGRGPSYPALHRRQLAAARERAANELAAGRTLVRNLKHLAPSLARIRHRCTRDRFCLPDRRHCRCCRVSVLRGPTTIQQLQRALPACTNRPLRHDSLQVQR